jgi:hypothetical protein
MFRKISLALLAGASCAGAGLHQAAAIELAPPAEPSVIYANQPAQPPAAPVRTAYAERSSMGGGFIEFLFGDGPNRGERYQQQPAYQAQPSYGSQRPQQNASDPSHPAFDPKFEKQLVD